MNNIERNQSYIYQLYSNTLGLKTIQEPKGYENDTRGYTRDNDSRGFIVKTEIDLEFFNDGADYLYDIFINKGIQEKVILTKYEKDRTTLEELYKIRYIQEIDLGTLKKDFKTGGVTVSATEGGLFTDIKNRESDEYDLLDPLSADGIDIGAIKTVVFKPVPRSLFLESYFKDEQYQYTIWGRIGEGLRKSDVRESRTIPMKKEYLSGDRITQPYFSSESSNGIQLSEAINPTNIGSTGNIFFWRSDIERELKVSIKLNYKIRENTIFGRVKNTNFKVAFNIFKPDPIDGIDDILDRVITLQEFDPTTNINVDKSIDITNYVLELKEGESVGLCFNLFGENDAGFLQRSSIRMYLDIPKSEVLVADDVDYSMTISRCMKPLDFFDRIIQKITGKSGLVVSSIFGEGGKYENIVVDNGLWARGFPDTYFNSSGEEQKIQMKTSFKDAFDSFNYLEPLSWFTYFEGRTERIRIETAKYTQQNFIGLDLGEVDDIKTEVSKIDFFSNITLGHNGSMEYEELSGLDEPNGRSEFSTLITRNKSKYEVISKIRTDATGYELIRRKPFTKYPKEDTGRDSALFMHDTQRNTDGSYTHLLWNSLVNNAQVLSELPKGVFKPENLWNFRLSPMNRLFYGHGYSVKRGLYHYPLSEIRFNSSNANKSLVTKIGNRLLSEAGSVIIGDLEKPRVEAEKVDFTFNMTQEIEDILLGFTKVNNINIPNYFGLIKYKEKGVDKYGRLIKLETKDEAKIQLIKARI